MSADPEVTREITPVDIAPGVRVHERYRFGERGTVKAVHGRWAWIMWDEYPDDHQPSTHFVEAVKVVER